jgi:hypothetical protein
MVCGALFIGGSAWAAGPYDGNYTGTRVRTDGPDQLCPAQEDVAVSIQGKLLTVSTSKLQNFEIGFDPAPDGSFGDAFPDNESNTVYVTGRISGGTIEADATNYSTKCKYHWHLTKKT